MKRKHLSLIVVMVLIAMIPVMAQHSDVKGSIGIYGSAKKLIGDNADYDIISPLFGLKLDYTIVPALTISLNGGYGVTYPKEYPEASGLSKWYTKQPNTPFKTSLIPILADLQLNLRPNSKLNPYLAAGMGVLMWDLKNNGVSVHGSQNNLLGDLGAGIEWFLSKKVGLNWSLHYQPIFDQNLDMAGYGDVQTGNLESRLGLSINFGCREKKKEVFVQPETKPVVVVPPVVKKPEPIIPPEVKKPEPVVQPEKKPEVAIKKEAPIVLEGVNFMTGSATLVPGAKLVLDKVARTLIDFPEMNIEVRGYTDAVGSRVSNMKLSQRRADAVKEYLQSKGISATRVVTKGFGPDNPIATNSTVEGRAKNRRIEFIRIN
jgi:outer membrane protein OmpA-like peptidoglycan-associated protein/opacity protein-like surface antigen